MLSSLRDIKLIKSMLIMRICIDDELAIRLLMQVMRRPLLKLWITRKVEV